MKSESTREVSYGNSRSDTQRYLRLSFTSHSISIILREYYTACKKQLLVDYFPTNVKKLIKMISLQTIYQKRV